MLLTLFLRTLTKEDLLFQLPESINVKSKIMKSEEMLSSQMLSGIPEVDLGKSVVNVVKLLFLSKHSHFRSVCND